MSIISPDDQLKQFEATQQYLLEKLSNYPSLQSPHCLIICGSGLGGISQLLQNNMPKLSISYECIPGFAVSHVPGHFGKLVFGHLGSKAVPVMCLVGRFHYYEGHSFFTNTLPIRVAKMLGVEYLIVTNAAGGVNTEFKPGDLMVINDHINFPGLAGQHPLRGLNLDSFGPRFLPLSDAYDFDLRLKLFNVANEIGITRPIHEGTYFYASGPTFESRAECRMLRIIGADAVGMSTVPEVIVARHCGMKVLGISLITNSVLAEKPISAKLASQKGEDEYGLVDESKGMASHDEVLQNANMAAEDVKLLIEKFVSCI